MAFTGSQSVFICLTGKNTMKAIESRQRGNKWHRGAYWREKTALTVCPFFRCRGNSTTKQRRKVVYEARCKHEKARTLWPLKSSSERGKCEGDFFNAWNGGRFSWQMESNSGATAKEWQRKVVFRLMEGGLLIHWLITPWEGLKHVRQRDRKELAEKGQKKSTVATMGGFCGLSIKKYPSEGMKELDGGQLFR